jgi:hypothetical protein
LGLEGCIKATVYVSSEVDFSNIVSQDFGIDTIQGNEAFKYKQRRELLPDMVYEQKVPNSQTYLVMELYF